MTAERQVIYDDIPRWYSIAASELGVHELAGVVNEPRIVEYHSATTLKATDDATPWCSAFANWCMLRAGHVGTQSAAARSWAKWGDPLQLPKLGAVVVFSADDRGPAAGHVSFFVRESGKNYLVLGGNQLGDKVCVAEYPKARVIAVRWPK